jgi:hypothetical protein
MNSHNLPLIFHLSYFIFVQDGAHYSMYKYKQSKRQCQAKVNIYSKLHDSDFYEPKPGKYYISAFTEIVFLMG